MTFEYPAHFQPDCTGELVVSFRDLPECLTSGANEEEAFLEAQDALKVVLVARLDNGEKIPSPSPQLPGEHAIPTFIEKRVVANQMACSRGKMAGEVQNLIPLKGSRA